SPTALLCARAFLLTAALPTRPSTLSLHDALPILAVGQPRSDGNVRRSRAGCAASVFPECSGRGTSRCRLRRRAVVRCPCCPSPRDRKSTRLNSSHEWISYAVFCLKKKKKYMYVND